MSKIFHNKMLGEKRTALEGKYLFYLLTVLNK